MRKTLNRNPPGCGLTVISEGDVDTQIALCENNADARRQYHRWTEADKALILDPNLSLGDIAEPLGNT